MLEDIKKDAATRMAKCVQNFQADLKSCAPAARTRASSSI